MLGQVRFGERPWPVFMFGGVGAGKTCASLCILDEWASGSRCYITVRELCYKINEAVCRRSDESERSVWRWWRMKDIAVLDELGCRGVATDAHYETVKTAIDERQGKPTIYISNLGPAEIVKVYDDRVASRLQSGTVIDLTGWPDRRLEHHRQ